ncbi:MAG TPA: hypothetical protein VIN40_09520 [Candidatus Tyrphobacter sp.]
MKLPVRAAAFAVSIATFVAFVWFSPKDMQRAQAMPPFAQAYGVSCSLCHTQVPALNAYGRYVQRTGYASLDPQVLQRALPVWIGENTSYDSQGTHQTEFGNLAIHAVGPIGSDITYHFQQWIWQNDQAGDLDTFWVAYNNVFHRDGHLFVGKIEAPGPSPFSQWFDLAGFATPEITVGEHPYQLDANRWGAKLNYIHGSLDAEAGWLGSGSGWGGLSDFSNDTDKTFQYKLAYANPVSPVEFGAFGSYGSFPLAEGGTDQYRSIAGYVQRDPLNGVPGVLAIYQTAYDANPGMGLGAAASTATTLELYEPVLGKGLIAAREEWGNDGLGNHPHTGDIDFSYHILPFVHVYVEDALAQYNVPEWRYMIWLTVPIRNAR